MNNATTADYGIRRFTDGDALVTVIMNLAADTERTHYGVVTRVDASLVGTYYPADIPRQTGWTVVTATAKTYHYDSEPAALRALAELAALT